MAGLVSPSKASIAHPLLSFRQCWKGATAKEKDEFDFAPWKEDFDEYLTLLCNSGNCFDVSNPTRRSACDCMSRLRDNLSKEAKDSLFECQIKFFMMSFEEQRTLIVEWKRYAVAMAETHKLVDTQAARPGQKHQVYLLPGSSRHMVCKNAIAKLVAKSRYAWTNIKAGNEKHGLASLPPNKSLPKEVEGQLFEYFFALKRQGTPRATRIVSDLSRDQSKVNTELKDVDLVELPACYTKRSLHRSFLKEQGILVQYDSKSRLTAVTHLEDGSDGRLPVSWGGFCSYWKRNFPKVVIQRASEDPCDDCIIFANRHKHLARKREPDDEESSEEEPLTPEAKQALMTEEEDLVIKAGKHVEMARKQRELHNSKKIEARHHAQELRPQTQRTHTYVADFAQNMYLPNFSAEQPGATYYYSPLNVYPFGVVDASTEPTLLTAFVYNEGDSQKGGNQVASMIWKLLERKGLMNGVTSNEINFIFDNCGGQNKNRMVYRMLFYLVKLKICRTARAIFLIKGHTKNDCDRMFNLIKYDYTKVDCFTPSELMAIVNQHPLVTAVPMDPETDFKDWDALEDTMIGKINGLKKNHVFTVRQRDSNNMMIQEYSGGPISRQTLVLPAFRDVDWRQYFKLQSLKPPGLADIKWNELFAKWGKFIPEERKEGLRYYVEKPPETLKRAILQQSADAKAARAKRTKGGIATTTTTSSSSTAAKGSSAASKAP